jgi:hypothetical protein
METNLRLSSKDRGYAPKKPIGENRRVILIQGVPARHQAGNSVFTVLGNHAMRKQPVLARKENDIPRSNLIQLRPFYEKVVARANAWEHTAPANTKSNSSRQLQHIADQSANEALASFCGVPHARNLAKKPSC